MGVSYVVNPSDLIIKSVAEGAGSRPGEFPIDDQIARECGLRHGQVISLAQFDALRDHDSARFLAAQADRVPRPARNDPTTEAARPAGSRLHTVQPTVGAWTALTSVLAVLTWGVVVTSCLVQKHNVDRTIRESFDISAIQIQQLNGSATLHVIVAIAIGVAGTIPFLIAVGAGLLRRPHLTTDGP